MPKAVEVFTPTDLPTFTYVRRATHKLEDRLREAFEVPKMVISLSGPSKSGKTVLVNKVVEKENLIPVSGASIKSPDDLWSRVLAWMDVPSTREEVRSSAFTAELEMKGGGEVGIPLVAKGKAEAKGGVGGEVSQDMIKKYHMGGLAQVVREIGGSGFVLFVDDFHYIAKDVQQQIGKQIKEATEHGVRVCTASVPHRSDDVVRSNPELRGRVTAIDVDYWKADELEQIAFLGFKELNVDVAPNVLRILAGEAFGSPQLMQAICLNFCFENKIRATLPEQRRIEMDFVAQQSILERTSTLTDFSSMISTLHSGPRQRGMERKVFEFNDSTKGDVYRCVLLAIKADPPRLSFPYDEILRRTKAVCKGESPLGGSIVGTMEQMSILASTVQEAPVIEWDEGVLDIVEPYFLFFIRCSSYVQTLGTKG